MTVVALANVGLWFCIIVLAIYTIRHYFFTLNRLFGRHRQPFVDIIQADWPPLIVFVPAHNESRVVRDSMDALLTCDYPPERLLIVPIDDRSVDDTREILLEYAENYPGRIVPFLRDGGTPGKAAALAEAMAKHHGEIYLVFDADYIPGERLLKQLVAPFFDPEVGAVMGRAAADLATEAKRRGKTVHMGRVNSEARLRHAMAVDCDTADGTFIAFGPDINLRRLGEWFARMPKRQPPHVEFPLFEVQT
jgi:cellulose synthase/poly-beta-1,6-N-acetylglucosamine synthase-like glycosyltransferase